MDRNLNLIYFFFIYFLFIFFFPNKLFEKNNSKFRIYIVITDRKKKKCPFVGIEPAK